LTNIKSWIKAARLRTLPLSLSGIIIGSSIAYEQGVFKVEIFIVAMLVTVGFQIISNFANDYGDGVKGTDDNERIGPKRALQSGEIKPRQMLKGIKVSGIITLSLALYLVYISFGIENIGYSLIFIGLGLASIYAAIKYTVGDNAYGYYGFGDIFVFLFFGILSVCGSYFLYAHTLNLTIFLPAFTVGLLSVGVLNLNNMRDMASDKKSGKNTIVVKIGAEFARYYHYYLLISAFLSALLYTTINFVSINQFLYVFAFIPIINHLLTVYKIKDPKDFDPELKKLALSTFLLSILFALGQIL
jgi:1,4-dihydroxy-2-naphthoate octaprenyltransferase